MLSPKLVPRTGNSRSGQAQPSCEGEVRCVSWENFQRLAASLLFPFGHNPQQQPLAVAPSVCPPWASCLSISPSQTSRTHAKHASPLSRYPEKGLLLHGLNALGSSRSWYVTKRLNPPPRPANKEPSDRSLATNMAHLIALIHLAGPKQLRTRQHFASGPRSRDSSCLAFPYFVLRGSLENAPQIHAVYTPDVPFVYRMLVHDPLMILTLVFL